MCPCYTPLQISQLGLSTFVLTTIYWKKSCSRRSQKDRVDGEDPAARLDPCTPPPPDTVSWPCDLACTRRPCGTWPPVSHARNTCPGPTGARHWEPDNELSRPDPNGQNHTTDERMKYNIRLDGGSSQKKESAGQGVGWAYAVVAQVPRPEGGKEEGRGGPQPRW